MKYAKITHDSAPLAKVIAWAGSTTGKLSGSPYANRTLAFNAVIAEGQKAIDAVLAEAGKPECAHDFDGATCKHCGIKWSKVPKLLREFWAFCNETLDKHNADEKTAPERNKLIHGILGVEHLEDCDQDLEGSKDTVLVNVEAMYPLQNSPDQLIIEAWRKIIPELGEIRPEFKLDENGKMAEDKKTEAKSLVLGLYGEDVTKLPIADIGLDGVMKKWYELKDTLKLAPAQPKNGNKPHDEKPAEQPKSQPKPTQQTTAVATAPQQPQNIIQFNSPELAALEAKRQEAAILIKSGLLPKSVDTPEKVIVIAMMGDALGIQKIVALNNINVIAGKPTVSPQLMLALVRKSKQLEDFSCTDDGQACTVKMTRKGEPEHVEIFSMDDAKRMMTTEWVNGNKTTIPLSDKANWKQQPATMRKWRAIAAACRVVFPDITWGLASYTPEEMDPNTPIDAEYVETDVA